ncbi:hypothetical protein [Crossiella equi]|uniref:hypothetical protein n=1 Tax=Crossiella equi TaxID=130796 RepID=UPI0011778664|nr:hypothetical protein [Crossiella equi]
MLAVFRVAVGMRVVDYLAGVRAVLSAAIRTMGEIDAGTDDLPEDLIPDWFAEVTRGSVVASRGGPSSLGVQQYVARRGEEPWELQDWLFCFDPKLRGWAWWDATEISDESVALWVDSSGEPVFPCEELRWLAYACGAQNVEGPSLASISDWQELRQGLR